MIFICDANNNITTLFANNIHQGELNANHILMLAPYPKGATVTMRVTLPNGLIIPTGDNLYVFAPTEMPSDLQFNLDTVALNAWSIRLDAAITQYAGSVTYQLSITLPTAANDNKPLTYSTSAVVDVITRGVPDFGTPPDWDEMSWAGLLSYASSAASTAEWAEQRAMNAQIAAESAAESAMGAVPVMTELDKEMLRTFGGVVDGVTYENPEYYYSDINWQVLLRCNRAYVQAYDSDDEFRLRGADGKGLYALKALIRYGGIGFTYDDGTEEGLHIDVMVPRYPWMKKTDWTGEGEPSWTDYPYMSTLCERRPDGRIRIPRTFSGVSNSEAAQLCAPKDYVDNAVQGAKTYADGKFLTETAANQKYASKISPPSGQSYVYIINGNGNAHYVQIAASYAIASTIPQRNTSGGIVVKTANENEGEAVSLPYANSHYLTTTKANSSYAKKISGENASNRYVYTVLGDTAKAILLTKKPSEAATDTVPFRDTNGKLRVGTPTYDGSGDNNCAVPLSMLKDKLAALKAEILAEIGG